MDILAQNVSPYYNDYDRSKEFLQVLFKPSSRVQARELTQMQSILQEQIATLAEYLLDGGNVVQGVGVSVETDTFYVVDLTVNNVPVDLANLRNATYTTNLGNTIQIYGNNTSNFVIYTNDSNLVAGEFFTSNVGNIVISTGNRFAQGDVYRVVVGDGTYFISDRFVEVTGSDFYPAPSGINTLSGKVGFVYEEVFISAKDDNTLNDPAKGTYGYSGSGADRLTIQTTLEFFPLGIDVPENFLPLVCFDNGAFEIVVNTAFMDGPNFTNVELEHDNGKWNLIVSGNENAGTYELNICDVPIADNVELTRFLEENGEIVFLDDDGTDCCLRKTNVGNIVPIQIHAVCSGSEPIGISINGYWLDTSDEPPILRRKVNNTTWVNVDYSNYFNNFSVICIDTGDEYILRNGVLVLNADEELCSYPILDPSLLDGTEEYIVCFQGKPYKLLKNPEISLFPEGTYFPTLERVVPSIPLIGDMQNSVVTQEGIAVIRVTSTANGQGGASDTRSASAIVDISPGDVIGFSKTIGSEITATVNNVAVCIASPDPQNGSSQNQLVAGPANSFILHQSVNLQTPDLGFNIFVPI